MHTAAPFFFNVKNQEHTIIDDDAELELFMRNENVGNQPQHSHSFFSTPLYHKLSKPHKTLKLRRKILKPSAILTTQQNRDAEHKITSAGTTTTSATIVLSPTLQQQQKQQLHNMFTAAVLSSPLAASSLGYSSIATAASSWNYAVFPAPSEISV